MLRPNRRQTSNKTQTANDALNDSGAHAGTRDPEQIPATSAALRNRRRTTRSASRSDPPLDPRLPSNRIFLRRHSNASVGRLQAQSRSCSAPAGGNMGIGGGFAGHQMRAGIGELLTKFDLVRRSLAAANALLLHLPAYAHKQVNRGVPPAGCAQTGRAHGLKAGRNTYQASKNSTPPRNMHHLRSGRRDTLPLRTGVQTGVERGATEPHATSGGGSLAGLQRTSHSRYASK